MEAVRSRETRWASPLGQLIEGIENLGFRVDSRRRERSATSSLMSAGKIHA
jgi:hypothetical protein